MSIRIGIVGRIRRTHFELFCNLEFDISGCVRMGIEAHWSSAPPYMSVERLPLRVFPVL